jgi:hypothetical protein
MTPLKTRLLLLAAVAVLAFAGASCYGTVSMGVAVPIGGPYGGGSMYVGGSVPIW